jgi:hypothetical protein
MKENDQLLALGTKAWEHRREFGLSKKLSEEIQREAATLCHSGVTAYAIGKALGVPRNTIADWARRFIEDRNSFCEVSVVDSAQSNFEIRLSGTVQGCGVEIRGTDFSLLQRLLKKMSS